MLRLRENFAFSTFVIDICKKIFEHSNKARGSKLFKSLMSPAVIKQTKYFCMERVNVKN